MGREGSKPRERRFATAPPSTEMIKQPSVGKKSIHGKKAIRMNQKRRISETEVLTKNDPAGLYKENKRFARKGTGREISRQS